MPALVNTEKCDGCGACVGACPNEAITLNEIAHIDKKECVECEACVDECPNGAISIV